MCIFAKNNVINGCARHVIGYVEMKKYNENQLWEVTPQEASEWMQKQAIIYRKDGGIVKGKIALIGRNALPLSTVIPPEVRSFTDLTIGDQNVDLRDMKGLDIED